LGADFVGLVIKLWGARTRRPHDTRIGNVDVRESANSRVVR